MEFLKIIGNDILTSPAFLLGIISLVGLLALKKPFNKLITGTLKPILGYIMLGAGADFIVKNLDPLGKMIQEGFGITGVVPNNEAITSISQNLLGKETMFILVTGLVINIIIFFIGEDRLGSFLQNQPILGPIIAGLLGLIPNCAASVIITQMFLDNVISVSTMISGGTSFPKSMTSKL